MANHETINHNQQRPLDEALRLLNLQEADTHADGAWARIRQILQKEVKAQSFLNIQREKVRPSEVLNVPERVATSDRQDINLIAGTLYDSSARIGDIFYAVHARLDLPLHGRSFNAGFETSNAIWKNSVTNKEEPHVKIEHDKKIGIALGLDTERVREIDDCAKRVAEDPHADHVWESEMFEELLQMIEPTTKADQIYAGIKFGKLMEREDFRRGLEDDNIDGRDTYLPF